MLRKTAGVAVAVFSLFIGSPVWSGEPVAIVHEGVGDTEHVAGIDPSTGDLRLETGAADCCWVSTGVSAIDDGNGNIYFLGAKFTDASSSVRRVFKVDVATGAVLSNPLLDGGSTDYSYSFLEYREATGTLYAVAYNSGLAQSTGNTTRQTELLSINTATGAVTTVGSPIANCCWTSSGASALDDDGGYIYFLGAKYDTDTSSQRRVFKINVGTAAVASNPLLDGGSTDYGYNFLERDPVSGTLYAVAYNSGLAQSSGNTIRQEELLSINTSTGGVMTVGSGIANCCWVSSGTSGFDGDNGLFYFLGANFSDSSSQRRIYSVNASTGAVVANPLVDGGSTTYSYNFMEFSIGEIFSDGFESNDMTAWTSSVP
jgi:hypothetical protein